MNRVQQIVPISEMKLNQAQVVEMLTAGPVVLANRSKPAAVLVSVDEWDAIADELAMLRLAVEARRIAAKNDAAGSWVSGEQMRERMAKHGVMVG